LPIDIPTTDTNGSETYLICRRNGEQLNITIDNDNFDDAHDFLIEKRNLPELGIQIQNVGTTNGLSYEIYGNIDSATTAPAFALKQWELATNGSGDLAALMTKIFETKFAYVWLLVRLKSQTASNDTTAELRTTGVF